MRNTLNKKNDFLVKNRSRFLETEASTLCYITCHLTHDCLAAAAAAAAFYLPAQWGRKTPPNAPQLIRGTVKRHSGLSGDRGGGKLAHIRLIRGPQSPLTFASQSQVARCLCYRLDYVSSALNSFVQIVLKAEREKTFSGPRTAILFCTFKREIHPEGSDLTLDTADKDKHSTRRPLTWRLWGFQSHLVAFLELSWRFLFFICVITVLWGSKVNIFISKKSEKQDLYL